MASFLVSIVGLAGIVYAETHLDQLGLHAAHKALAAPAAPGLVASAPALAGFPRAYGLVM